MALAPTLFGEESDPGEGRGRLARDFLLPPFTVLNAREGWWQERKRAWLALGIQSELGRGEMDTSCATDWMKRGAKRQHGPSLGGTGLTFNITAGAYDQRAGTEDDGAGTIGTSVFDPVVCELAYRWFCPPGGRILDPFAGGSVRGVVASELGFHYTGIDLRPEQISMNQAQGAAICNGPAPVWLQGDSRHVAKVAPGVYDMLFSCPPYGDLEKYSDDPADISTLEYPKFKAAHAEIIAAAAALLKPDAFACWVIGDFRCPKGFYRAFPWHTVEAFEAAGLRYYNEAVLVTAVGSLPVRVKRQFSAGRKLGKAHQNILVFVKGDPRRAAAAIVGAGGGPTPAEAPEEPVAPAAPVEATAQDVAPLPCPVSGRNAVLPLDVELEDVF